MQDFERYQSFARTAFGFEFNDPQLLVTAFTHRSYVNEHRSTTKEHNERLEFLGDAVLELIVTEFLFAKYKDPEGVLTSWRSALVRTESIGQAAERLGFSEVLRMSKGERRAGSERAREQMLANSFEAVVGAIYLDQGYEVTKKFIEDNIIITFDEILRTGSWRDSKSLLQEIAQSTEGVTPSYRLLSEDGPDHDKIFTIGAFVGKNLRGKGSGSSKQAAQQQAAENALHFYAHSRESHQHDGDSKK
ncbi:MAG TPA: ribonuclease III [Candidatus Saccharimonadales bacterium]|nr:ribonuclease III [Candidatus Saccharimonadales bacterium]